jgi:hypothetical protein
MSNHIGSLAVNGFALGILKQLLGMLLQAGEASKEHRVAANLHKSGKDLKPDASNAADFIRHATRQFAKVTLQSGFVADEFRNFEVPRISTGVAPQLTPGTTTAQGVHLVGEAIIADLQSLVGSVA